EASVQGFDNAGRALSIDWQRNLDGKQVERWSEKLGAGVTCRRDQEVLKLQEGQHPPDLPNDPQLLVIAVDGGRWQGREQNPETHSRWREDKVCAIATYMPGDGKEKEPQRLLTTYTATVRDTGEFDSMCRLEAERRGLRQAEQVIALADGGNWIDPLLERQFHSYVRIIDWRHAQEHLYDCAKAATSPDSPQRLPLAKQLEKIRFGSVGENWRWPSQSVLFRSVLTSPVLMSMVISDIGMCCSRRLFMRISLDSA